MIHTTRCTSLLFACLMLGVVVPLWSADPAAPVAKQMQQEAMSQAGEVGKSHNSCPQTQPEGQGAIDAKDWVQQAQALIKSKGLDAAAATFNDPGAQWVRAVYYIVIYKMDGTCLVQSKVPKEAGANGMETADPEGKKYIKEMIETAKASGEGWVDYQWMDPEAKKMRTRGIYFQKIEGQDAVVGCVFLKRPTLPVLKERPKLAVTQPQPGNAGKSHVFIPELNLIMHWCPPGTFTLGTNTLFQTYRDSPPHQVTLTRGFWIGETEVTQSQWEAVMGSNPSRDNAVRGDKIHIPAVSFKGPDLPVNSVTWDDVMDFCKKLTDREHQAGRLPADAVYTLPTEAQWVYAAAAGSSLAFDGDLDTIAWYQTNGDSMLHPVAQKLPNAWGLYDTHGNAWEFCSDWLGDFTADAVTDPVGPPSSGGHVIRGGGWDAPYNDCLTARRKIWPTGSYRIYVSFRIICTAGHK